MSFFGLATSEETDALARQLTAVASSVTHAFATISSQNKQLISLLTRIGADMASFDEAITDLAQVTDEMADELDRREAIISELTTAPANGEVAQAQALAEQADAHTAAVQAISAKLRGLGQDPENPVPDTTPLPVPDDATAPSEPVSEDDALTGDGSGDALPPVNPGGEDGDVFGETGETSEDSRS